MKYTMFGLWAALAAAPFAGAQDAGNEAMESPAQTLGHAEVMSAFDAWRAEHGAAWELVFSKETMNGRFLYGGSAAAPFRPATDEQWFILARQMLARSETMHGIPGSTLVEDAVLFLPLGNAGTTDKMTVQFRQVVRGVPVIRGFANALFDMRGRLLSVDTTALPGAGLVATEPSIDAGRAYEIALKLFTSETGLAPTSAQPPELAIDGVLAGKSKTPVLVWRVAVAFEGPNAQPEGYEYRIDAASGKLASRETTIHHDVSGNVKSYASQSNRADIPAYPAVQAAMANMTVTSGSGNATTNAAGDFNIAGASAPLTVTVRYVGPFATVNNSAGGAYTLSPSLGSPSGNAIVMNPASAALITAQANAFLQINNQRDWTRSVIPGDATHDFLATANVNIGSSCNAYYNGSSVNFYQAGGGCVNTCYGDVVAHEMGHWMNDRYGSGNGSDGFGEGNSDVIANYFFDDPVLGHDFSGTGTYIRTGLNTRQFCGDSNPGCYGEVHYDGEVLMGALWKVRARLKTTLGTAAGGAVANTLFFSWMNAYNDGQIRTIVETHWLTLDDNDGNIGNGTPHHDDIDGGFVDQGFPGHALQFVSFSNVTQLPDTQNQFGPYVVNADAVANITPPVTSVALKYRVNHGAFNTVAMTNTVGSTYSASIPGQLCPTVVDYYVTATDSNNGTNTYPSGAPTSVLDFLVGNETTLYSTDFESGAAGWTHALVAGQDDWQISSQFGVNTSYGKVGDPTSAPSGTNIWGNDLGPSGWNGEYAANVSNWLRSPIVDCTGATGTHLKFQRWLRVEEGIYDNARVKVNGTVVWQNQANGDLLDTAWVPMDIDISAYADNNPSVQLEFSLQSDVGLQYGGWNIDDVSISYLTACAPICPPPTAYCAAKLTSQATLPTIDSTGSASLTLNNFAVTLGDAIPQSQAICFWSLGANSAPFKGGTMCVLPPLMRTPLTMTDVNSAASLAVPIDASMVGTQRRYQWWFRDPLDSFTVGLSGGLLVDFCQ